MQIVTDHGTDHVDAAAVTVGPWINTLLPDLPRTVDVRRVVCSWHPPTRHDWFAGGAPAFVRSTPVVTEFFPGLIPTIVRSDAFPELFTEDRNPLLGWLAENSRVCCATGFSGHGFTMATGYGHIAAHEALGSTPSPSPRLTQRPIAAPATDRSHVDSVRGAGDSRSTAASHHPRRLLRAETAAGARQALVRDAR